MLLHLSDVHVTDPASLMAGFADGEARLRSVIDHVLATGPALDGVLVTGDLVDGGTPDEYDRVCAQLTRLGCPWFPLPGNHDLAEGFARVLDLATAAAAPGDGVHRDGPTPSCYTADAGPVRVVVVDSTLDGHHDGGWDAPRLEWLDATLAGRPGQPTVVATHHPPIGVGLWHMDYGGGRGGDALGAVVARHPQVILVACGHVHRRLMAPWAGTLLSCAPALTYLTEALLTDDAVPHLHNGPPEVPLYRFVDGRLVLDTLDWRPGVDRAPLPVVFGDGWPDYERAARSGTLPRNATGH